MSSRRDFIKQTLISGAAIGLTGISGVESLAKPKIQKLTILHTNDMHSRVEPFPLDGTANAGKGGMARRAALIKQIRQEEEHILLFDSGDIFQGTPYFNMYGGEVEFKLMSQMGYDAATLGNHDFDNGLIGLENQLPNASFPFLIANYDFTQTRLNGRFEPYKIFEKGGLRIGVFGLGIELEGLVPYDAFEQTKYLDPVAVAKEMVQELRQKKCDLIVCLSHLGYKYGSSKISDTVLAQQVAGIDLILGGHTHTFLDQPDIYVDSEGGTTMVNQAGWAGMRVGRIDFEIENRKKSAKSSALDIK
ncbi:bifunctional metallophosphatase/5'-nucleotidase [Penaeicola halotolerans]|uniref:bifunctional metallophosphatase/5'-nucleotidase n=1 Tax=Penaeicola halotolerans TaxID=2793196 RepID=UPI001CF82E0E|nr:metallophosphatase [Penaeicola halotolerans]